MHYYSVVIGEILQKLQQNGPLVRGGLFVAEIHHCQYIGSVSNTTLYPEGFSYMSLW